MNEEKMKVEEYGMKATGSVRRVDELGRLQIPKNIRRQLHIKESAPIEFYIDEENIVLKKYHGEENET